MILRHRSDVRTLVWALALMPAAAIAQYAVPGLAWWLLPVSGYLAYSAGVIAHNHNHSPTFVGRRLNALLSAWISIFYGHPTFVWIPTHNDNHHRFRNRAGDASITWRATRKNGLIAATTYFFVAAKAQAPLTAAFLQRVRARRPRAYAGHLAQYIVVYGTHAAALALAIAMHGGARGAAVYASALGMPAAGALWGLMFTNYVQHVDCDPWSRWNHSRDFVSGFTNFFVFDNGFHTVHHERPGLHWSELRRAHAQVAHLLDPRLQERTILRYCFKAYVLGKVLPRFAPVPVGSYDGPSQPRLTSAAITSLAPSSTEAAEASTTTRRSSSDAARARCSSSAAASIDTTASSPASATARAAESHRAPPSAESSTPLPPRSKSALSTA
ncbi:MAG TPA: fatty acid desaturase [Polyangiaceae bacterium]|nr:fatty acid desaturase [Polyangiaceae bacterium]